MCTVTRGGDICPINRNEQSFEKGEIKIIYKDLLKEFKTSNLSIINFECPLIEEESPIFKNGPTLVVSYKCINGIIGTGINLVNLANNHILDHDCSGLINTLKTFRNADIPTVGVGRNIKEARKMYKMEVNDIRIGIMAVAEHEFSIATKSKCGANPLDIIEIVRCINNERNDIDYLIILIHGGNEHYPYPSPRLQKLCRFLVELGANTVIVQHTHCPGSYEFYKDACIVYGQGNLIFDSPNMNVEFYHGFLVKLIINKKFNRSVQFIPFCQSAKVGIERQNRKKEEIFLKNLKMRSEVLVDEELLRSKWLEFCENQKNHYLSKILLHNRVLAKLNSYNNLIVKLFYSKKHIKSMENMVSCEAHREVLETILKNKMI